MGIFFQNNKIDITGHVDTDGTRSAAAMMSHPDVVTHVDFQIQAAIGQGFWSDQRGIIMNVATNQEVDWEAYNRVERRHQNFSRIANELLKKFGDLDQVHYFLNWYFLNRNSFVKIPFIDLLKLIGVNVSDLKISEEELLVYQSSTEYYCARRRIISDRFVGADVILQLIFNAGNNSLPLNYKTIAASKTEIISPSLVDVIRINEILMNGGSIYMYCCPNYAGVDRADGSFEYTMDGLGDGIGQTAKKGLPAVVSVLENLRAINVPPITIEVGIADFEATESNAQMVGLSTVTEFEQRLGGSIRNMFRELEGQLTDFELEIIEEENQDTIGKVIAAIRYRGRVIAYANFSRITDKPAAYVGNYKGKADFDPMVDAKREELAERAVSDRSFQKKIDKVIQVRISLMVKWTNIADSSTPEIIKDWFRMYHEIEENNFENIAEILNTYGYEFKFTNDKPDISYFSKEEREEILRIIIIKEIFSKKPEMEKVLEYFRKKVARQGAEYAVMHELMSYNASSVHFAADAINMWQVFGNALIQMLNIKGGYEGSKAIAEG